MGVRVSTRRKEAGNAQNPSSSDVYERLRWLDDACQSMCRNNPAKAKEYAAEALQLATSFKDVGWMATAYVRSADCARLLSDYGGAAQRLEKAVRLLEGTDGYDLAKSRLFRSQGKMCSDHRGDTHAAIVWYDRALVKARTAQDPREVAQCLLRLGESYLNIGGRGHSATLLAECLELSEAESLGQERATALLMLGLINTDLGQYTLAEDQIHESMELFRKSGDLGGEARATEMLAYWHVRAEKVSGARDLYLRAIRLFERKGDRLQRALALMNMGHLCASLGDHQRALECMDEVVAFGNAGGNPVVGGLGLIGRGESLGETGDLHGAIAAYEKALEIMQDAGLQPQEFRVVGLLARAHEQAGNLGEALVLYKRFMELDRKLVSLEVCRNVLRVPYDRRIREAEKEVEEHREHADRLEEEAANRSGELESIAGRIAENDRLLASLRERLVAMENIGDTVVPALREVIGQIDLNAHRTDIWQTFADRLKTIDQEFIHELVRCSPGLTPAELRVCTLLRISMSNQEIASILNLSARTVESHRLSVRRKLGLAGKDDLLSALAHIQDNA